MSIELINIWYIVAAALLGVGAVLVECAVAGPACAVQAPHAAFATGRFCFVFSRGGESYGRSPPCAGLPST